MQNAKDTFYAVMRERLVAGNAERMVVVRGMTRPGLVVEENEAPTAGALPDCFRLRWTDVAVDTQGTMPMVRMRCEVLYETAGAAAGGVDRGRALAAMDEELLRVVRAAPQRAVKTKYAATEDGGSAVAMATNVWWSDVGFGATVVKGERVARTATVDVMSYEEAGEA